MNGFVIGATAGVVLALSGLVFGFWGAVLVAALGAVGALIGASVTGRVDLRAALNAARGRRTG